MIYARNLDRAIPNLIEELERDQPLNPTVE